MEISWSGFHADIEIIDYKVSISSHSETFTNDTVQCHELNVNAYDVKPLYSVGLNEYVIIQNLTLTHGSTYFVTVVAEDEAGMCIATVSQAITVDTTPPAYGQIKINDIADFTVIYARKSSELHVGWNGFLDEESGLQYATVMLFECEKCINSTVSDEVCLLVDKSTVYSDSMITFYELSMSSSRVYYVVVGMTNGADLFTTVQSPSILVDESPLLPGQVKITSDWNTETTFQSSTDTLVGLLPIATSDFDYKCPSQVKYFPNIETSVMRHILDSFSGDFLVLNSTGAYLGIGYNSDLTNITTSGIMSEKLNIQTGNYTFTTTAAIGFMTITTVGIVTDQIAIPYIIEKKPEESVFDTNAFNNVSSLTSSNITLDNNETLSTPSSISNNLEFKENNDTNGTFVNFKSDEYGFGIHFLGYKIGSNSDWHHAFWATNKYTTTLRWFKMTSSPWEIGVYTINVKQRIELDKQMLDLALVVNGEELVTISGFQFDGEIQLVALTWNENDYMPPLFDIYNPFYSDAVLRAIDIPDSVDKPCRHGVGFYDGQSAIKELWLGVSDIVNEPGNIKPMELFQRFCFPCIRPCLGLCELPCNGTFLTEGFNLIPIQQTGLLMESLNQEQSCTNITSEESCNSTAYYINAKLINFAGQETYAFSNGIQIDTSPPVCYYVKCTDPTFNIDQPTKYLGSSSSIGAYWNCTEKESQIVEHKVEVVHKQSGIIVFNKTSVGLSTKHQIFLDNGTLEDMNDYQLSVYILNTADLVTTGSCSVRVNLFPPDVSNVDSEVLFTDGTEPSSANAPYWASSQTTIGMQWNGGTEDTEFYGN